MCAYVCVLDEQMNVYLVLAVVSTYTCTHTLCVCPKKVHTNLRTMEYSV